MSVPVNRIWLLNNCFIKVKQPYKSQEKIYEIWAILAGNMKSLHTQIPLMQTVHRQSTYIYYKSL